MEIEACELMHVALCQIVQCLNQGNNYDASQIARQALVDYADLQDISSSQKSEV